MTERASGKPITYHRLFIGGRWVEPQDGTTISSLDPSTGEVWAVVASAGPRDVDAAVNSAREAFEGPWRNMPASERGALLHRLAQLVLENKEKLAELETRDSGMLIQDARGDVDRLAHWLTYYAGAADKIQGEVIPTNPAWHSYATREPVGVVAAITPWNTPLLMYANKLGPALAAGCTMVLKPSELTPVTALELARLIEQAGFPPGVVNVIPGDGAVTGHHLANHPGVNKIAFTGSHEVGTELMKVAGARLKRFFAECGGKAPQIIFADADLDRAFEAAMGGAFRRCGQSCALGSRIFVEASIYDRFVHAIAQRAANMNVGSPFDEKSHLGPQISSEQLEKTLKYIELGRAEGARLVVGGSRPDDPQLRNGFFVQPTVFADVDNRMRIAQDEIFGPVASVIPFESEDELIQQANDVIYGLTASAWTNDVKRAHRLARELQAGSVWINVYPAIHWTMPYGGFKMSGIGRVNGMAGIDEYLEIKSVVINFES